jgi:hypothetical protein
MPRYSVTYEIVAAASPLEALLVVHRDGLGRDAVRLVNGTFGFGAPADRELCPGQYRGMLGFQSLQLRPARITFLAAAFTAVRVVAAASSCSVSRSTAVRDLHLHTITPRTRCRSSAR